MQLQFRTIGIAELRREGILQWTKLTMFSVLFAGFTGLCAQVRFYLPFTPVPVTGQVFAVLLSGVVLGKSFGSLSQMLYIGFGLLGIPWFVIGPIGPTGGYLVGFIVAPFIIGFLMERWTAPKTVLKGIMLRRREKDKGVSLIAITLAMLSGVFIIYLFGSIQFSIYTRSTLSNTLLYAVVPFIPFDIGKALTAAVIARYILK